MQGNQGDQGWVWVYLPLFVSLFLFLFFLSLFIFLYFLFFLFIYIVSHDFGLKTIIVLTFSQICHKITCPDKTHPLPNSHTLAM